MPESPLETGLTAVAAKEVKEFVDDLKYSLNKKIRFAPVYDKICMCGMGGSGIGSDVLADFLAGASSVPVFVIKSMDLPNWVNSKTLIIASSYSGNTLETLSMYDQAKAIGCPIIAMSSGGKLKEKCQEDGFKFIYMRKGIQPRSALGLTIGYMVNIIEAIGAAEFKTEIRKIIPQLYKVRNSIDFKNQGSPAKEIAEKIYGKVPVIYSTQDICGSAVRWKTQINENSKMIAFNGTISELYHNGMREWSDGLARSSCCPVILYEEKASSAVQEMADRSIEAIRASGTEPIMVVLSGSSIIERSLTAIMLGDYVSVHLAHMNGVDPIEVNTIVSFKERVTKRMASRKSSGKSSKV